MVKGMRSKVLNSVSVVISDWISKRNISCFGLFRCIISGCTGYNIYIYIYIFFNIEYYIT